MVFVRFVGHGRNAVQHEELTKKEVNPLYVSGRFVIIEVQGYH
jgi:hypothetical protein